MHLTSIHKEFYQKAKLFVDTYVKPNANDWDEQQGIPENIIKKCTQEGYLGCLIPTEFGGLGLDTVSFGLLNEAFGAGSSSLTGLITVQAMVASCIWKWGTEEQKNKYLPALATGNIIASFAMTEPRAGSDTQGIGTAYDERENSYYVNGAKKWISFSGLADIFLVFGLANDKSVACIIDRQSKGIVVNRIKNIGGFKSSYISEIEFNNCEVPKDNQIGRTGAALNYIAPYGFHYGRLSTAWSAVGLIRSCLELSADYAHKRFANGSKLIDHQIIRKKIAEIGVNYNAAYLLCLEASISNDRNLPKTIEDALIAKLFASKKAVEAANNLVQVFGANAFESNNPASRIYRDAKIMEIIEGTSEIHENILGRSFSNRNKNKYIAVQ